eukprot:749698-Hanusia_phi.AAC.1
MTEIDRNMTAVGTGEKHPVRSASSVVSGPSWCDSMHLSRRILLALSLVVVGIGGYNSESIAPDVAHEAAPHSVRGHAQDACEQGRACRAKSVLAAAVACEPCLRLRGGKIKYKNLREVKQQRLADEKLAKRAEARRKQKGRGRPQQRERPADRRRKFKEQEQGEQDDMELGMGMLGQQSLPSDEAERDKIFEAQEEALKLVEPNLLDAEAGPLLELSDEFPPDSESRGGNVEVESSQALSSC